MSPETPREAVDSKDLGTAGYDEMDALRQDAASLDDITTLRQIAAVARSRDGLDDTDARFAYLAMECDKDVDAILARQE